MDNKVCQIFHAAGGAIATKRFFRLCTSLQYGKFINTC